MSLAVLERAARVDSTTASEAQSRKPKRRCKQPAAAGAVVSHDMPRANRSVAGGLTFTQKAMQGI